MSIFLIQYGITLKLTLDDKSYITSTTFESSELLNDLFLLKPSFFIQNVSSLQFALLGRRGGCNIPILHVERRGGCNIPNIISD